MARARIKVTVCETTFDGEPEAVARALAEYGRSFDVFANLHPFARPLEPEPPPGKPAPIQGPTPPPTPRKETTA